MRGINVVRFAVVLVAIALASNCSDTNGPVVVTGDVRVVVSMSGFEFDPDGFSLVIDGSIHSLRDQSVTFTNLREGDHELRLEGVAANCQVTENPRTVTVVAGRRSLVEFAVTCSAMGGLSVNITTVGEDYPALGFWLLMEGGGRDTRVTPNATFTTRLPGGTITLRLSGTPENCTIAGGNTRTVTIVPGETAEATFASTCAPTHGVVRITTVTTGSDPDRNGYWVRMVGPDAPLELLLPTHGNVHTRRIRQGNYEVTFLGNTVNCPTTGTNPRNIDVAADTLVLTYEITCEPVPRLAFDDGRFGDLWIINAHGEGKYRIFQQPPRAQQPRWSPDGRKIVFTSNRDGNLEIYVGNADGSGVTRLTNTPAASHSASWSPDGSSIVFVEASRPDEQDPSAELYVMRADGTIRVRLTSNEVFDGYPAWSPAGNVIAFASDRTGNREIHVMNADGSADGSNVTRITSAAEPDYGPAWSPDGRKLAFARSACYDTSPCYPHARIILSDAAGGAEKVLATGDAPAWSPDGRTIAYNASSCGMSYYYYDDFYCTHSGIGFVSTNGILLESNVQGYNPAWRR